MALLGEPYVTVSYSQVVQAQITYSTILQHLGSDVVRVFLICGVSVLLYTLINIFVSRDTVLISAGPLLVKVEDFDFFMLLMGIYFTLMGGIYYLNIPL